MGYGFVEYQSPSDAKRALKDLQHASFNGHTVELKISHRTTAEFVLLMRLSLFVTRILLYYGNFLFTIC